MKIRKNTITKYLVALIVVSALGSPMRSFAQGSDGLSLTITPPLFQFTIAPGESWASSVKVVNGNSYDITVYATPINFESVGEGGKGAFIPLSEEDTASSSHSLAGWIDITDGPIVVPRGESVRVPFFINAPSNAEPGGHYASILIGTKPMGGQGGSEVKVSSLISTLLFARVSGDIVEEGRIRQFSVDKSFVETPKADFMLRFENLGNVHILPRGTIIIYNMWGKERGRIEVNKDVNFGNVLPESVRSFAFSWEGESNFYDIGRYRAIATLSYGVGEKQSDFQTVNFWVVPFRPLLWIVGVFGIFLAFMIYSLRRYVKHALKVQTELLLGDDVSSVPQGYVPATRHTRAAHAQAPTQRVQHVQPVSRMQALKQPVIQGAVDLRRAGAPVAASADVVLSKREFVMKYKRFIAFLVIFIVFVVAGTIFFKEVLTGKRDYEIKIQEPPIDTSAIDLPYDV